MVGYKASDRTKDLDKVVTEELLNLHRGQGLDLLWRDTLECPTEAEYIEMVNNSMFRPTYRSVVL
jgi:geranylgeranyl diphosphate synthase type 3